MLEGNEPPLIKYEEIPLPEERTAESRPGPSKDEDVSSSEEEDDEEEEEIEEMEMDFGEAGDLEDSEKGEAIRADTIGRVLDFVFVPRKIRKGNTLYLKRLSREAASRDDVMELSKTFEDCLKERQVKMSGYCPIRRELYDLLFDELIRQSTIQCAERGSLLLRVRDEFRMTMDAYQKLYECGVEYGSRKANEAQFEQQKVEIKVHTPLSFHRFKSNFNHKFRQVDDEFQNAI
ncbi:33 kDa inner dynein arm light chain, axonemal [Caerostris darwini]|uniref:33 kDa inner dynein arm light chain, axonemal n=1 Tax=Caerostris darwini TaxID=1538125 RepID=A0AAV4QAB9_9ARAC|nr:33 kDa inner dynein arm light chain, axonemal [Caerostris darwini]